MSELHKPEWYGEYAVIKNKYNDYVQVEYKCNGTGLSLIHICDMGYEDLLEKANAATTNFRLMCCSIFFAVPGFTIFYIDSSRFRIVYDLLLQLGIGVHS